LQYVSAAMDRESQELKAHSQSWPPGFMVASAVWEPAAPTRRRDGLTLVCLAVCAWSLGYGLTEWVCDSNEKALAVSRQQAAAVAAAKRRPRAAAQPSAQQPGAVLSAPMELPPLKVPALNVAPRAPKRSHQPRAHAAHTTRAPAPAVEAPTAQEPSPVVSVDEMNKTLALADASKRIFASVDEAAPQPVLVRPPPIAAQTVAHTAEHAPDLREAKAVAIEALSVDGGLPSNVVSRGVQRLLPQYDRCREYCDSAPQRLKLSTTIDEAGHGRHVTVEGLSRPTLRRCIEQATAHLVVPAPDTGTARARWIVRFAP
jgi:hypothetical protein